MAIIRFRSAYSFDIHSGAPGSNFLLELADPSAYTLAVDGPDEWTVVFNTPVNGVSRVTFRPVSFFYDDGNGGAPGGRVQSITLYDGSGALLHSFDQVETPSVISDYISSPWRLVWGADTFFGSAGNDTLDADLGDDILNGGDGADMLDGGPGDDIINGDAGSDYMMGMSGDDIINGGAGNDTFWGGDGDDIYISDSASEFFISFTDPGADLVMTTANSFGLGDVSRAGIENLTFIGTGEFSGGGNELDNIITGGAGNDSLTGWLGADTLIGKGGNDRYNIVDTDDIIIENPNEGIDTIHSTYLTSYDLRDHPNIENLHLVVSGEDITALGNSLDNSIAIYGASSTVRGFEGNDTLAGDEGSDLLIGDSGDDQLFGYSGNDILDGGAGSDVIRGGSGNNTFRYRPGDVGAGEQIFADDGNGNPFPGAVNTIETYGDVDFRPAASPWFREITDVAFATGGVATFTWQLINSVPDLHVVGSANTDTLRFFGSIDLSEVTFSNWSDTDRIELFDANYTTGSSRSDHIFGTEFSDRIDGGPGADIMAGGDGSETYYIDNPGDQIIDNDDWLDAAYTSISLALGPTLQVDYVRALPGLALNITGNDQFNALFGNAENNVLSGGGSGDMLEGGGGADILLGGDGSDNIFDGVQSYPGYFGGGYATLDGGNDYDVATVGLSDAIASVSFVGSPSNAVSTLVIGGVAAGTLVNFEWVTIHTGAGADVLRADANTRNTFYTGGGDDILVGGALNDALDGGVGNDDIDGGDSSDTVVYEGATSGVTVSLALQGVAQNTGGAGVDTLRNIENLSGSAFNDILTSGAGFSFVYGGDGDDTLIVGEGNASLNGGPGDDRYFVKNLFDSASEVPDPGGGVDIVFSPIDWTLQTAIENLTLLGAAVRGTGNELNNTLIGNDADNILSGSAGADQLDGGAGADTLFGGDGDDFVYFDPSDAMPNVQGEAGFDTLVFTSGPAPIAFDLTAHGFECAEGRLADTKGQAWATQTNTYDAQWRLDRSVTVNDDATAASIDYDQADAFVWSTYWRSDAASGAMQALIFTYDDGHRDESVYDAANAQSWTRVWTNFNVGGQATQNVVTYDNGAYDTNVFDASNTANYSEVWASYNAAGQLVQDKATFDGGAYATRVFDPSNAHGYALVWSSHTASGQLAQSVVTYDSGAYDASVFDAVNAAAYATVWSSFNTAGQMLQNVVTYDNGAHDASIFDAADAFDWAQDWKSFDALSRLDADVTTFDDGSYAVVDFDQANAHSWANLWWLYDAGGSLVAFQGVNDDGSIFT